MSESVKLDHGIASRPCAAMTPREHKMDRTTALPFFRANGGRLSLGLGKSHTEERFIDAISLGSRFVFELPGDDGVVLAW